MEVHQATSTIRMQRLRQRRRSGLASFSFVADEVAIKMMLEDASLLSANAWDDPIAVVTGGFPNGQLARPHRVRSGTPNESCAKEQENRRLHPPQHFSL
jgi:hypothetical protein